VINNGYLLHLSEVRQAVCAADVILPSLDAGTPAVFQTINRPLPSLDIEQIIQGLVALRKEYKGQIWLEILFCRGVNDSQEEVERMREAIRIFRPDKVQLNTVVRPGVEDYAAALAHDRLEEIKEALGEAAEIITEFEGDRHRMPQKATEERLLRIIQRRPETPDDLAKALGLHDLEIAKILDRLAKEGKVTCRVFNQRVYYEAARKRRLSSSPR
jgi:wyosine [tRNA(Phe)-imidazoG37] synthetase (radical SAM superfamily)